MGHKLQILWKTRRGYTFAGRLYSTFWSNLSKNFSFLGPVPLSLHQCGWNLARRRGPLLRVKFHPIGAKCHPCWVKNLRIGLWVN